MTGGATMSYTHTVQNKQKKRGGGALLAPAGDRTRVSPVWLCYGNHWARQAALIGKGPRPFYLLLLLLSPRKKNRAHHGAARGGGRITGAAPAT